MLSPLIYWASSLGPSELAAVFCGFLFVDAPRYAISKIVLCLVDLVRGGRQACSDNERRAGGTYCPSVCVIVSGWNEAATVDATLRSMWGTYPRLEIIFVDDGSEDGTAEVAMRFARSHPGVLVLRRPDRGGKSSAMNLGLKYTAAEVIITVDADSHLAAGAIWAITQPLDDPRVGAVSASIVARNPFENIVTWLQAAEYLTSVHVGRILSARLGMLSIASGAFAAFRREAIERGGGWDPGPGEDADITIRVRKSGYRVAFVPEAECFTNVPTTCRAVFKQRLRWNRSIVRFSFRKHADVAYLGSPSFRITSFLRLLDVGYFCVLRLYGFWFYLAWCWLHPTLDLPMIAVAVYLCYIGFAVLQIPPILFYSNRPMRDLAVCCVMPLAPFYQLFLRVARTMAITDEFLFRGSYRDEYVPRRVRAATWHW